MKFDTNHITLCTTHVAALPREIISPNLVKITLCS